MFVAKKIQSFHNIRPGNFHILGKQLEQMTGCNGPVGQAPL